MPRLNPTFSDIDILRFIAKNLTIEEKERVICTILISTGKINGRMSGFGIGKFLKDFRTSPFGEIIGLMVEVLSDQKYDADY